MHTPSALRAPAAHRVIAAVSSPVLAFFVARLVLRYTALPATPTYAVCLLVGLVLAWRAWSARVELTPDAVRLVNTLATTSVPRADVRRVSDRGRVESGAAGSRRTTQLPAEALHQPWWVFGQGRETYGSHREQVRAWLGEGAPTTEPTTELTTGPTTAASKPASAPHTETDTETASAPRPEPEPTP